MRARNWCFTLNNPDNGDFEFWEDVAKNDEWNDLIQYVIIQEEVGEEGTVHLQGYLELKKALRMGRMKNLFGQRYHFEKRRGTQSQAIAYCKKVPDRTGGFTLEYGVPKRTGAGGRLADAVGALKEGKGIDEIADQFPTQFVMWKDKLEDYALGLKGERDWAMDVQIYVGASGTGKSYTAQQSEDFYVAPWPTGGRWWWPHYKGQYTVIMDEFRHQIKMDVMLKMMDRYVWHLEAKGRNFEFCSRQIIITTNVDPKNWYPNLSRQKKEPLARRIREFATIWDFHAADYPNFVKTVRAESFQFNEGLQDHSQFGGYMRNYGRPTMQNNTQ